MGSVVIEGGAARAVARKKPANTDDFKGPPYARKRFGDWLKVYLVRKRLWPVCVVRENAQVCVFGSGA